jgi:chemotaxis regulatin CheY-phosphate phosphatase CheZ
MDNTQVLHDSSEAIIQSPGKNMAHSWRRNWTKSLSLSKSMPSSMQPSLTAEDEEVSSMRTFKYLKLDATDTTNLPAPLKFAQSRTNYRLRRSVSDQGISSLCRSEHLYEAQSSESDASIRARLHECLFMDDFQMIRPMSLVGICESLMTKIQTYPASKEGENDLFVQNQLCCPPQATSTV